MQLFIARAGYSGLPGKQPVFRKSNLLYIMRVGFFILFFSLVSIQLLLAKSLSGQSADETYIVLELKNVPLATAFKKIEKMTDFLFAYQPHQLDAWGNINLPKASRSVSATMRLLLQHTDLVFIQEGKNIIIRRDPGSHIILSPVDTTVTGVILNAETKQPVDNISVVAEGAGAGTTTDASGRFRLTLGGLSGTLVISSVGYETQRIRMQGQRTYSILLKPANSKLDDVVVIGYGAKKKIDLTGTVNSMDAGEIAKTKGENAQDAMQGRLPGVDIKRSSGRPGADFSIEIRGVNSITGSTQPLYVVDGIPTGNINDINPADIERIDVLKDASSTAIYGSRGANGVVIVTTKRGSKGATKVTYDAYVGAVNAYHLPPMMNGPEFVAYAREFYNTQAAAAGQTTPVADNKIFSATELTNIAANKYMDWYKLIRRSNALQTNHNLSITGGDEKTTYFLSAGYQLYNGAVQVENTKKYTLKVGMDKTFGVFKAGASVYNAYVDINPGSAEVFRSAGRLRPTGSAYNADGSPRFFVYEGESQITNPLFEFTNELRAQQYVRLLPNVFAEATPIKGLKFRTSFTPDITFQRTGLYDDTYTKANAGTKPSSASNGSNHWFAYTLDNVLSYNNHIKDHQFDVMLGNSLNYYQYDYNSISVVGLPYRSLWFNVGNLAAFTNSSGVTTQPSTSVASGYNKQTIASFFFRANYTFNEKYLLTFTGRGDGNSIFADGHKWGFFPSGALAWIVSKERFMQDLTFVNLLKLRFSYGQSGNAATSSYLGPYVTQSVIASTAYDFNGANANGYAPSALANKNLTWEKTTEYNAGLDMQLWGNRIGLQLDLYRKTAKGSIFNEAIPAANGFSSVVTNLGSVRNSGIEVALNTVNIRLPKFTWTSNLSVAFNKNQIVDLFGNGTNDVGNLHFLGQKVRVVYQYKIIGVWQASEAAQAAVYGQKPGQYKIQDITTSGLTGVPTAPNYKPDGVINSSDRQILGSDIPNWFGGLTNTFNYANFDLSFTVYTRQGTVQQSTFLNQFLDGDQGRARFNAYNRSYWTSTNPSNRWANNALETDGSRRAASEYINSSYTKISNIILGYTLPKRVIGKGAVKNLRIYVDAYNPFIFTKFIGWDPETADLNSGGLQDFRTRTLMFGINLGL